ncbi:oxalate/formate MFS antiporter [Acetobacter persici]|uniref:Oxalate/formate MFS antiporter n=1 Tax=Acetobacter persici TaxID=1076596 RepID=A0A6V8IA19_9PROT|nr:oxalate/formate MFS antiporter [Acetobacter persici]OUI92644.1 MFS transporter [Acetobacter persici]GFE94459.1 oxalate/formate MFS antiporter [Acetobacter persici]
MIAAKWRQMIAGLVCMGAISSPQYVWTLFTPVLKTDFSTSAAALQITFSLLIVLQTLFSPIQGWIARHVSPRTLIMAGIVLTGLSWVASAQVHTLTMLYLTYGGLGGVGTGIVYVGVVSLLMQWFPKNRGMAAGAAAAGYGMGAMLTTFPISHLLAATDWRNTMMVFGVIMAVVGVVAACFLKVPESVSSPDAPEATGYLTSYVVRTPLFWLMFFMMATMATSGLMVTSQLAQIGTDFGVAHLTILGMAALPLAMTLDRIANGVTRPLFGWVSDHLGREQTMAFAFSLEALALTCWLALANHPVAFVLLSGIVFLGWGEIFSLFPATLTDTFGTRDASRNYGLLYMAQGVGAVFGGPLAAWLHQASGNWHMVFTLAIGGDLLTAFLALAVLRPLRHRFMQSAP